VTVGTNGSVTVNVEYGNSSALALPLACLSVTDPATTTLDGPDGKVYHATRSYCSEHPLALLAVPPGGHEPSYPVFEHVTGGAGPYTLNWQAGDGFGGTVTGIRL
jgi:hypothetical protein